MSEAKTTNKKECYVSKLIDGVENARRKADALVLLELFEEITGKPAVI